MVIDGKGKINTKFSFVLIIGLILIGLIGILAYYNTTTSKPQALLKEKIFNDNFNNFIIYVDKIEGGKLGGVHIWELLPKGPPRVITAQEGEFITSKDKDTLVLRLGKGTIEQVYEKGPVKYHKSDFTNHFIKLTYKRSS